MDFFYFFGVSCSHDGAVRIVLEGFLGEADVLWHFFAGVGIYYGLSVAFERCLMAHVDEKNHAPIRSSGRVKDGFQPFFPSDEGVRYECVKTGGVIVFGDDLVCGAYVVGFAVHDGHQSFVLCFLNQFLDAVKGAQRQNEVMVEFDGANVRMNLFQQFLGSCKQCLSVCWFLEWKIKGEDDS